MLVKCFLIPSFTAASDIIWLSYKTLWTRGQQTYPPVLVSTSIVSSEKSNENENIATDDEIRCQG